MQFHSSLPVLRSQCSFRFLSNYCHFFVLCSPWKFMVFVHAKIGALKVKDLSQKLQGISGFIFHLQLCEGQQLKHQILLKSHTEWVMPRSDHTNCRLIQDLSLQHTSILNGTALQCVTVIQPHVWSALWPPNERSAVLEFILASFDVLQHVSDADKLGNRAQIIMWNSRDRHRGFYSHDKQNCNCK